MNLAGTESGGDKSLAKGRLGLMRELREGNKLVLPDVRNACSFDIISHMERAEPGHGGRVDVATADLRFEREPLVRPFGFKGGSLSELWQVAVCLRSPSGRSGIGLGTQSVLWSDAAVFADRSEAAGNELMLDLTRHALDVAKGGSFETPLELLDVLFPEVLEHGRRLSGMKGLRPTFALNALVAVDNAAWVLYARENGFGSLDAAVPERWRGGISARHPRCAMIPLVTYGTPLDEVRQLADEGAFFFKIKIGQPGTQEEMLAKDFARVAEIHEALRDLRTPCSENGRALYYFDANGRYGSKDALLRFADHLEKIGALDQTAIVEEPFDELEEIDVSDVPFRIAADESAHTVEDAERRMDMGYGAMALKPIAKTMSMSIKIAAAAAKRGVPCFCADLTVNPVLVEWNRAVAERLPQFPGIGDLGLLETNGAQNYRNWPAMLRDVPQGGIFAPLPRYERLFGL